MKFGLHKPRIALCKSDGMRGMYICAFPTIGTCGFYHAGFGASPRQAYAAWEASIKKRQESVAQERALRTGVTAPPASLFAFEDQESKSVLGSIRSFLTGGRA